LDAKKEIESLLKPNYKHVDRFVVGNAVKIKPEFSIQYFRYSASPNNIWIITEASIRNNLVTAGLYKFENVEGFQIKISMSKLVVDDDCIKVNRKLRLEHLNNIIINGLRKDIESRR